MSDPPSRFEPVYQSKNGIAGYGPVNPADHAFAFDGASSGKRDHIVFYRSGGGQCSVIRQDQNREFSSIYSSTEGIGYWDFMHIYDRAFAFDYEHSGKMDHILCYRPASGGVFIIGHDGNGTFWPVYAQSPSDKPTADAGNGIGGYDMRYPWDRIIAFDFDKSKKVDALLCYRRWCNRFCVLKNENGRFYQVYHDWCWGFGDYHTAAEGDYAFAFDYQRTGCLDHILFFTVNYDKKPICGIITRQDDKFVTVWKDDNNQIGGYPRTGYWEIIGFTYDYDSSGMVDHFGIYWMNHGRIWIMHCPKSDGKWETVYKQENQGIGNWDCKGNKGDRCIAFDYDSSGKMDHLFVYRRSNGAVYILKRADHKTPPRPPLELPPAGSKQAPQELAPPTRPPSWTGVVKSSSGVANFDFGDAKDRCFAFDYTQSGRCDHLVVFRPGGGLVWIITNDGNNGFKTVSQSAAGIATYDMRDAHDRAFAFDFKSTGRLDHMFLYRPGSGTACVVENNRGQFKTVVPFSGTGIAGWDLKSAADRGFAFDFDHSGKRDYIVLYRPGGGNFAIIKVAADGSGAKEVVASNSGVFTWDLKDGRDRLFAYDYDKSGRMDYIVLMRPGARIVSIAQNVNGKFTYVYSHSDNGAQNFQTVIGGYDLNSNADRAFPYDHDSTGKMDHIAFYRPGQGRFTLVHQTMGGFSPLYQGFAGGKLGAYANKPVVGTVVFNLYYSDGDALGGYDISSPNDHMLPFDYNSTGCMDHIVAYRPGSKLFYLFKREDTPFIPGLAGQAQAAGMGAWGQQQQWGQQWGQQWATNAHNQGNSDEPPPGVV